MDNKLEKVIGLYGKIRSGYYLKNSEGKHLTYFEKRQAYEQLKQYIDKIKTDSDIIIYSEDDMEIIINTVDKTLPLDRFVYIDKSKVDIDNLSDNIK